MSKKALEPVEILTAEDAPTPRGRPPIRLDTVNGCLEEMAAVYRAAKHGRMDINRATKLAYMLQIMLRGHETAVLEARVTALEGEGHGTYP